MSDDVYFARRDLSHDDESSLSPLCTSPRQSVSVRSEVDVVSDLWCHTPTDVCTPREEKCTEKSATRSVCTHPVAHTIFATTCVRNPETKPSDFVVPLPSWFLPPRRCPPICFPPIIISECFSVSRVMLFCWFWLCHCVELNSYICSPRSIITICESHQASRASLGSDHRGNCDVFLILESDLLLGSCLR